MSLQLGALDPKWLLLAGGVVALLVVANRAASKLPDAAAAVGRAIDPTSDQNVAYQGANRVVQVISGSQDETLGGWLYDLTHRDPVASTAPSSSTSTATPPLIPTDESLWGLGL